MPPEDPDGLDGPPEERRPERGGSTITPARRYSFFVGLAFLALVGVATLNTLRTEEGGVLAGKENRGWPLPEFAVPSVGSGPQYDANVYQDDCATSQNPCPDSAVRTPACQVEVRGALRVCDYFDRPLVLSFWFTRGGNCLPAQDDVDQAASRYGGRVRFLSVNVRDDPDAVREIVTEHGWKIPVGYDRDGAVSDIYQIGVCPTVVLAYPGGILHDALVGDQVAEPELDRAIQELLSASRRRAQRDV